MAETSWWARLSRLGRSLAVVACCGSILCIILSIVIAVLLPYRQSCSIGPVLPPITFRPPMGFPSAQVNACQTPSCLHTASKILKSMNTSVDPCDNFYQFVCGNFMEATIIPDEKIVVNAFTSIEDELQDELKRRIEEIFEMNTYKPTNLVRNLYKSCMNIQTIEKEGVEPLLTLLEELGGWPVLEGENSNETDFNWMESVYKFRKIGLPINYFIGFKIDVSMADNTKKIIYIDQPSFGLAPGRLVEEVSPETLTAYYEYMVDVAVLLGASEDVAKKELTESLQFEKELAKISLPTEKRMSITKTYVTMTVSELSEKYSSISWKEYLNKILAPKTSVDDNEKLNILVPNYIFEFQKLIETTPRKVQANYVMWRAVVDLIEFLSENIRNKQLDFESKVYGKSARESRWQECVRIVSDRLSSSVASLYIKRYFNAKAREEVIKIFLALRDELSIALQEAEWMDDDTKKNATRKASVLYPHIGYSDGLMDGEELENFYQNLELSGANYLRSILNVTRFKTECSIDALRKPFNRDDWEVHADPVTVSIYYTPILNSIDAPAAILRGRFFNRDNPNYMNYGGIGFLLGHEMIHGFDELGRYFDKDGNVASWWTPETETKYAEQIQCLVAQYGNYTVPESKSSVNGVRTRDENFADNGGVRIAYGAYKKWAEKNKVEKSLPGLDYTPQQMFWISVATASCSSYRPENLKLMIDENSYSPPEFRIVGSLSNMNAFSEDFNCSEGTRMNPKRKCSMW